jgi:hypothetical protein
VKASRVKASRVKARRVKASRVKASRVKASRVKARRVKARRVKARRVRDKEVVVRENRVRDKEVVVRENRVRGERSLAARPSPVANSLSRPSHRQEMPRPAVRRKAMRKGAAGQIRSNKPMDNPDRRRAPLAAEAGRTVMDLPPTRTSVLTARPPRQKPNGVIKTPRTPATPLILPSGS